MDKYTLNNKIIKIMDNARKLFRQEKFSEANAKAEELEKLVETYLTEYPHDTEMWLKLALVEDRLPLADYVKAIECVKKILSYDPNNTYAAILLTHFLYSNMFVDEECLNILSNIKTEDNEFKAMLEYAKSLYYWQQDHINGKWLQHKKKASFYWQQHVNELLLKYPCNNYNQISDERIRANLQLICKYPEEPYNPLSVEQLLNEFIRSKI